jgi:hypothetical protein
VKPWLVGCGAAPVQAHAFKYPGPGDRGFSPRKEVD